jgi:site-specific DNA-methyltransferase (adenine-specific)
MSVMKPGAHLLAFGGTRTYARMAVAIEDAGFEIRDCIAFMFGSGFPKSHSVSGSIDKSFGHGPRGHRIAVASRYHPDGTFEPNGGRIPKYEPKTPEAQQWDGWGTALKPAMELICVARKPLSEKTVAANVLQHGTGAINVDGCRIAGEPVPINKLEAWSGFGQEKRPKYVPSQNTAGRWPANVTHDGSEEVLAGFPEAGGGSSARKNSDSGRTAISTTAHNARQPNLTDSLCSFGDSGSAARFFYTSKASASEREGSKHPTVKPLDLMRWLVRLVTPPGGTVLDPFAGSGTTGVAAVCEGMDAILIEREPEYIADIERRVKAAVGEPQGTADEPSLFL